MVLTVFTRLAKSVCKNYNQETNSPKLLKWNPKLNVIFSLLKAGLHFNWVCYNIVGLYLIFHRWWRPWKVQWWVHSFAMQENGEVQAWENNSSHSKPLKEMGNCKIFFFRWHRLKSTNIGNFTTVTAVKCDHFNIERYWLH